MFIPNSDILNLHSAYTKSGEKRPNVKPQMEECHCDMCYKKTSQTNASSNQRDIEKVLHTHMAQAYSMPQTLPFAETYLEYRKVHLKTAHNCTGLYHCVHKADIIQTEYAYKYIQTADQQSIYMYTACSHDVFQTTHLKYCYIEQNETFCLSIQLYIERCAV